MDRPDEDGVGSDLVGIGMMGWRQILSTFHSLVAILLSFGKEWHVCSFVGITVDSRQLVYRSSTSVPHQFRSQEPQPQPYGQGRTDACQRRKPPHPERGSWPHESTAPYDGREVTICTMLPCFHKYMVILYFKLYNVYASFALHTVR